MCACPVIEGIVVEQCLCPGITNLEIGIFHRLSEVEGLPHRYLSTVEALFSAANFSQELNLYLGFPHLACKSLDSVLAGIICHNFQLLHPSRTISKAYCHRSILCVFCCGWFILISVTNAKRYSQSTMDEITNNVQGLLMFIPKKKKIGSSYVGSSSTSPFRYLRKFKIKPQWVYGRGWGGACIGL